MKRLILLRHAKAVSKGEPAGDFDRVLAKEGRREMASMARKLQGEDRKPDLVLVSSSARTRETWQLAGLDGVSVRFDQAIYDAEAEDLLSIVKATPDDVGTLMMVGHNPGFEDLANELAAEDGGRDRGALESGLPTAAVAVLDFAIERWSAVSPGGGRLIRLETP